MKIKHFGGIEYANNISEFSEILQKKYGDGVNEFWITNNTQENPCLVVLVKKWRVSPIFQTRSHSVFSQLVARQIRKMTIVFFILIRLKKRLKSEEIQLSQ